MNKDQLLRLLNRAGGDDWSEDVLTIIYLSDKLRELALECFQSEEALTSGTASDFVQRASKLIVEDMKSLSYVHGDIFSAIPDRAGTSHMDDLGDLDGKLF